MKKVYIFFIILIAISCCLIQNSSKDFYNIFNNIENSIYCYIYNFNQYLTNNDDNFYNKYYYDYSDIINNTSNSNFNNNNYKIYNDNLIINKAIQTLNLSETDSVKMLKNGNKMFVYFKNKNMLNNVKHAEYKQITGKFNNISLQKQLNNLNAKKIKSETYEDTKILFYYTPLWKDYKILDNKKVNLQIAINNNNITIGYPMIYGSF